jgi:hypothetical protein
MDVDLDGLVLSSGSIFNSHDNNVETLWDDLNLGDLLNKKTPGLQDKLTAALYPNSEQYEKHEKQWKKPTYAVLKSRYETKPTDPISYSRKSVDRLSNPVLGKFSETKIAEIHNNENIHDNLRNNIKEEFESSPDSSPYHRRKMLEQFGNTISPVQTVSYSPNHHSYTSPNKKKDIKVNNNAFFLTEALEESADEEEPQYNPPNNNNNHIRNSPSLSPSNKGKLKLIQQFESLDVQNIIKTVTDNARISQKLIKKPLVKNRLPLSAAAKSSIRQTTKRKTWNDVVDLEKETVNKRLPVNKTMIRDKSKLKDQLNKLKNNNVSKPGPSRPRKVVSSGYGFDSKRSDKKTIIEPKKKINTKLSSSIDINEKKKNGLAERKQKRLAAKAIQLNNKLNRSTSKNDISISSSSKGGKNGSQSLNRNKGKSELLPGGRVKRPSTYTNSDNSKTSGRIGRRGGSTKQSLSPIPARGSRSAPSLIAGLTKIPEGSRLRSFAGDSRKPLGTLFEKNVNNKSLKLQASPPRKSSLSSFSHASISTNSNIHREANELISILQKAENKDQTRPKSPTGAATHQLLNLTKKIGGKLDAAKDFVSKYKDLQLE